MKACRKCVGTLVLSSLSLLVWFFVLGFYGYKALTKEQLVAKLIVEPHLEKRFYATLETLDGNQERFLLTGDQVQIDAEIIKWHGWANLIGLHTYYELDRITGRFRDVVEQTNSRYQLGHAQLVDISDIRKDYSWMSLFYDASYGSSSYVDATQQGCYQVLVSTTGILLRPAYCDPKLGYYR